MEEKLFIHSSVHILYINKFYITGDGAHGKSDKNAIKESSGEIPVL